MAIVARKRKSGVTFYVTFSWNGKQVWERVGTHRREAETVERKRLKELKDGTYTPQATSRTVTVGQYAEVWGKTRVNAYGADERAIIRRVVEPRPWLTDLPLADARPRHFDRLVAELKAQGLADKSISNVIGVMKLIFNRAIRAELCTVQPVVLEPGTLKRGRKREPETYTVAEALVLTRHHAIPWPIRVLNAMCLFGGLREGEACGRRWGDLKQTAGPLMLMSVHDQYDRKPLKTERARSVPVHPDLAAVLTEWMRDGFELYTQRKPEPEDLIVPNTSRRAKVPNHTRSSYYKQFIRSAEAARVRPRSLHSTRHTFISLCRRGGARKDVLERVTHNARGDVLDGYTHFDWQPVCEAVLCLSLDAQQGPQPRGENPEETPLLNGSVGATLTLDSPPVSHSAPASIPGASTS